MAAAPDLVPRVDGARLWRSLQQLGSVGATASGGVRRIALTPEDMAGRRLVEGWAIEAGCVARTDAVGNLVLRRAGRDEQRPAVMVGSHLDTQPDGGRFDGALGVLAGLELLRTLAQARIETEAPIELAIWTDEEGARFDVSCVGSSVFGGALPLRRALELRDGDGVALSEALARAGAVGAATIGAPLPSCYFELHIEQGPVLEALGATIGVVGGIVGIRWLEVTLTGEQRHAGTTPMDARRDALLAAARLVLAVDELALRHGPDARGTVCVLEAEPNAGSVVVGRTRLVVDLRHPQAETLECMEAELRRRVADLGVAGEVGELWVQPPTLFDSACVGAVRDAAGALGLPAHELLSGAGHDAGYLAPIVPTAMVFIPCRGGISHHPAEHAEPEHVAAGADVLLHAVLTRADSRALKLSTIVSSNCRGERAPGGASKRISGQVWQWRPASCCSQDSTAGRRTTARSSVPKASTSCSATDVA